MIDFKPKSNLTFTPTKTPVSQPKKSLLSEIKDSLLSRVGKIEQSLALGEQGKQGLASTAYQTAGQSAAALGDVAFATAKAITPGFIKDIAKKEISLIAQGVNKVTPDSLKSLISTGVSSAVQGYSNFREQNPEIARNIEATANIASVIPIGKATSVVAKGAEKGIGATANVLEKSALAGIEKNKLAFAEKLVMPVKDKATKLAEVSRTTESGIGLFKKSIVEPTLSEKAAISAVTKVPGVSPAKTFQQNFNIINDQTINLAKNLKSELTKNNFLVPRQETLSKLHNAVSTLEDSPLIVGDAEKTAAKLIKGAEKFIGESSGDAKGILQARKNYDAWVLSQKPKAFDVAADNAFTLANKEIRNTFNTILEEKAPNIGVTL